MITNISLFTLWVTDQDASKRFYVDNLGFVEGTDVTMGDGFRWVTIAHPDHPELEVTLMTPGPPLDDAMATAVSRSLAGGTMGGFGLATDDCRGDYERLEKLGRRVHPTPVGPPLRRRGRPARQLRQLDRARRADDLLRSGLPARLRHLPRHVCHGHPFVSGKMTTLRHFISSHRAQTGEQTLNRAGG
jgi:catechol 2,3-dioxygenase-like lactoylglutathione lyase family enzyme